jgi:ABC-type oligopeptide transport system substrate-binding subunit
VTSASAPSATTVQLNFATPQYANLFLIGQVYIVPQHIWSKVANPVTFTDPNPVGTGPYMLDQFSPQGFTLKQNPLYYNKSSVHVPKISFPSYNTNANLVPPIASGQIDWAGNYITDIQGNYLSKSAHNHTWLGKPPYFSTNNVVTLFINTTKAPLNDPAVRQAIEFGINRQQLSTQAETGYALPTSSTSGLMLPATGDFGRFSNAAAQAALKQYESSGSPPVQKDAIMKLQQIMTSQVPVIPLFYGPAWAQYSTRNYTGWPTASNPYMTPVPNTPYLEYTVLQLKPAS